MNGGSWSLDCILDNLFSTSTFSLVNLNHGIGFNGYAYVDNFQIKFSYQILSTESMFSYANFLSTVMTLTPWIIFKAHFLNNLHP